MTFRNDLSKKYPFIDPSLSGHLFKIKNLLDEQKSFSLQIKYMYMYINVNFLLCNLTYLLHSCQFSELELEPDATIAIFNFMILLHLNTSQLHCFEHVS
jgi:hypothetical protein